MQRTTQPGRQRLEDCEAGKGGCDLCFVGDGRDKLLFVSPADSPALLADGIAPPHLVVRSPSTATAVAREVQRST